MGQMHNNDGRSAGVHTGAARSRSKLARSDAGARKARWISVCMTDGLYQGAQMAGWMVSRKHLGILTVPNNNEARARALTAYDLELARNFRLLGALDRARQVLKLARRDRLFIKGGA